ncbi:MAG: Hpt domain-containing protein [Vulcanimicrobiota bacterium]
MTAFDRDRALKTFGSTEVLREAGRVYLEEAAGMFERIRKAAEARDFGELRESAHWIKGGMTYLHAAAAADLARSIEELAKAEQVEGLDQAVARLGDEMKALEEELRAEGW